MKLNFTILLFLILFPSCSTDNRIGDTLHKDCYDKNNFSIMREYINTRIKYSGAGKLYIEYPPDKNQPVDSIKRPSRHPENVYDVSYDKDLDQIIFKNKSMLFIFLSNSGLINTKDHTPAQLVLVSELYCFILSMAYKTN